MCGKCCVCVLSPASHVVCHGEELHTLLWRKQPSGLYFNVAVWTSTFYISWSKWINSHSTLEYLSCRWMLAEWTLQARGGTWSLEISPSNRLIQLIWCLLGEILFFIKLYLSLQVQATVLGFLAALVASALGWILEKELIMNHVALLCCCSVVTAFTASLLQGLHFTFVSDQFLAT